MFYVGNNLYLRDIRHDHTLRTIPHSDGFYNSLFRETSFYEVEAGRFAGLDMILRL